MPKFGDKIPVDKIHISKLNVRANEPFGKSEEDQQLIANLRRGKIIGPFKMRPERGGFGVVVGRRRFLAKQYLGMKNFTVGSDCLVENMTDQEAWEASLVENLEVLRANMDPMTRAHALSRIVDESGLGVRGAAIQLGLKASTLSEWLKPLELSKKMQDMTQKQKLFFTDALRLAKMELGKERQDQLAEILEKEGYEPFLAEMGRLSEGRLKRGIPAGKYTILRLTLDHKYPPDMKLLEELGKRAEAAHKKVDEYAKWVLQEHVKATPL